MTNEAGSGTPPERKTSTIKCSDDVSRTVPDKVRGRRVCEAETSEERPLSREGLSLRAALHNMFSHLEAQT